MNTPSATPRAVVPVAGRRLPDRFIRTALPLLIAALLAACSSTDRMRDTQVRPTDRPECNVGSQRQDLNAGVPTLIGGTGCRTDPSQPMPLNKRTE